MGVGFFWRLGFLWWGGWVGGRDGNFQTTFTFAVGHSQHLGWDIRWHTLTGRRDREAGFPHPPPTPKSAKNLVRIDSAFAQTNVSEIRP